jgi:hypothetical protein
MIRATSSGSSALSTAADSFACYVQVVNAKRTDITVEHYSNIIMVGNLGVQQLTVS